MNSVTVDQVLAWSPCYRREKIESLFAERESLTAADILDLPIFANDRLWAVLREELIPAAILHEFACQCAEQALKAAGDSDPRSVAAIEGKRAWVRGEISDQDLSAAREAARYAAREAARYAARAAAWSAYRAAAWYADNAAASAAAWAAAQAAAWSEARSAQVDMLRLLLS